jgi:hypothetical protein
MLILRLHQPPFGWITKDCLYLVTSSMTSQDQNRVCWVQPHHSQPHCSGQVCKSLCGVGDQYCHLMGSAGVGLFDTPSLRHVLAKISLRCFLYCAHRIFIPKLSFQKTVMDSFKDQIWIIRYLQGFTEFCREVSDGGRTVGLLVTGY